jgi:hypothetical protein
MRLREWALSYAPDGARSPANCEYLDGLLRRGDLTAPPGVTISGHPTEVQGVSCMQLHFHLPPQSHCNGTTSIPVQLPTSFVGTVAIDSIFCSLIEEIIAWLAGVGPKHSLVRLACHSRRPQPRSGFSEFIESLRRSYHHFPGLGLVSGATGVLQVAQATTPSHVSGDLILSLTLGDRRQLSLFVPRSIGVLPFALILDWIEVQDRFCAD